MLFSPPNLITYGRLLAAPLIAGLMLFPGEAARFASVCVFVAAALSDYLDGFLARALNAHSALGQMLDPIADKLIIITCLVMLAADQTISGVHLLAAVVIAGREILISGLREFMGSKQQVVPVSPLAKWKTTLQLIAVGLLLAVPLSGAVVCDIGIGLLWVAAGITGLTGLLYGRAALPELIGADALGRPDDGDKR